MDNQRSALSGMRRSAQKLNDTAAIAFDLRSPPLKDHPLSTSIRPQGAVVPDIDQFRVAAEPVHVTVAGGEHEFLDH